MTVGGTDGLVLLERTRELEVIAAALTRAHDGHGTLVVIEGAAGEGKTALLRLASMRANGAAVAIIDDAHRLDAKALSALSDQSRDGIAVLAAFRPGEPQADEAALDALRSATGATRLRLGPLSPDSVRTLLLRRFGDAPEHLAARIHALTAETRCSSKSCLPVIQSAAISSPSGTGSSVAPTRSRQRHAG